MDLAHAFGTALKKHRKLAGLSQEALSEACEIERTFISMLERAQRRPSLAMTFELAKALSISPSAFVNDVEILIDDANKA